jgi:amino acid transporter
MSASKKIGMSSAVIIGLNAIIGAGVFVVPAALQTIAGPAGLITYAFVIIAILFMALSFAEVATQYPESGAFYTYAKQWGGHTIGALSTACYLFGLVVAMGLLSKIVGNYIGVYAPSVPPDLFGIGVLIMLAMLLLSGARLSQIGQVVLAALTLVPLAGITALCSTKADVANLTPFAPHGISGIFGAIKAVIFGFFGFEAIPSLFSIIENPKQNVPKAITLTVILVGIIYFTFAGSIILAIPPERFPAADSPLSPVLLAMFPAYTWIVTGIDLTIIATIVGTIHSMLWAVSTLFHDFSYKVSLIPNMTQKQSVITLTCCIALCTYMLENISVLFGIVALTVVLAYASAIVTLPVAFSIFSDFTPDSAIVTSNVSVVPETAFS